MVFEYLNRITVTVTAWPVVEFKGYSNCIGFDILSESQVNFTVLLLGILREYFVMVTVSIGYRNFKFRSLLLHWMFYQPHVLQ